MDARVSAPRRQFLAQSGVLAAGALLRRPLTAAERTRSVGANDRIRLGILGCGQRWRVACHPALQQHARAMNCEIVALCDTWRVPREQASGAVRNWPSPAPRQYWNHRDLMADRDVDAVMISTPDHVHAAQLRAAALARKHVYVENPLGTELTSVLQAVDAAANAGITVQVGTHRRSLPGVVGAREIVRSGEIGKLSRVDESRNDDRPFWYSNLNRSVEERDVHWEEFLGDRTPRPFDRRLYAAWPGYYEFCHGPVAQWGAHYLDTVHYVADAGFPLSCMCLGGASYPRDENGFTAPDNVMATWIYPDGLVVTSSNNFNNGGGNFRRFYGDRGTVDLTNWNTPVHGPNANPRRDATIRSQNAPLIERPDHYLDWLQCLRSGRTPHAPLQSGYQHTVAVLMAALSYETGKKTIYDPRRRRIETI